VLIVKNNFLREQEMDSTQAFTGFILILPSIPQLIISNQEARWMEKLFYRAARFSSAAPTFFGEVINVTLSFNPFKEES